MFKKRKELGLVVELLDDSIRHSVVLSEGGAVVTRIPLDAITSVFLELEEDFIGDTLHMVINYLFDSGQEFHIVIPEEEAAAFALCPAVLAALGVSSSSEAFFEAQRSLVHGGTNGHVKLYKKDERSVPGRAGRKVD